MEFETSVDYTVNCRQAWTTDRDLSPKNDNNAITMLIVFPFCVDSGLKERKCGCRNLSLSFIWRSVSSLLDLFWVWMTLLPLSSLPH